MYIVPNDWTYTLFRADTIVIVIFISRHRFCATFFPDAALRGTLAEHSGHFSYVHSHRAAAGSYVVDADFLCSQGIVSHLLASQLERIESIGKFRQAGEVGSIARRVISHGLAGEIAIHGFPHLLHRSKYMLWRTEAIHPNDVGAGIEQDLRSRGGSRALGGFIFIFEADRNHGREPGFFGSFQAKKRLAQPGECLSDDEVNAFFALDFQLFVEGLPDPIRCSRAVRLIHPGQA